jgi:hypothetical protein
LQAQDRPTAPSTNYVVLELIAERHLAGLGMQVELVLMAQ